MGSELVRCVMRWAFRLSVVVMVVFSGLVVSLPQPGEQLVAMSGVAASGPARPDVASSTGVGSWSISSTLPAAIGHVYGIACASASECFAAGRMDTANGGVIAATTDSGSTWTTQSLPSGVGPLSGISCPTSSECVVAGSRPASFNPGTLTGLVLSTDDSGSSWSVASLPSTVGPLDAVSCPSATECLATGSLDGGAGPAMLVSTDSGSVWSLQTIPSGLSGLNSISCPTASDCFAVGNKPASNFSHVIGAVIATTDAGTNWYEQSVPVSVPDLVLKGIYCVTSSDCMAAGYSFTSTSPPAEMIGTSDGGSSWSLEEVPAGTEHVDAVVCSSSSECFAAGCGIILGSTDGGSSWQVNYFITTGTFFNNFCSGAGTCLITTFRSILSASNSAGTWADVTIPSGVGVLSGIDCVSNVCVAVGSQLVGSAVALYSVNGGSSFQESTLPSGIDNLSSVSCPTSSDCIAVGSSLVSPSSNGVIVSSTNGGVSWQEDTVPSSAGAIDSVSCPTSSECVAVGLASSLTGSSIISTTDGGVSWQEDTVPVGVGGLASISCPTASECVAVGARFAISSTDGGSSWQEDTVPSSTDALNSVSCPTASECVAVGSALGNGGTGESLEPMAVISIDSGSIWNTMTLPSGAASPVSVSCTDVSGCMAVAPSTGGSHWDILGMAGLAGGITPPGTPSAVPEPSAVSLSWAPPSSDGGSPITHYVIVPYDGSTRLPVVITPSATDSFTVSGLQDGSSYVFTVIAENASFSSAPSPPSNVAVPQAPAASTYHPLESYRICDTRMGNPSGLQGEDQQCAGKAISPAGTLTIQVAGTYPSGGTSAGVPLTPTATAVALNVTVIAPTAAGYVTVYPGGEAVPLASTVNFAKDQTVAHFTVVGLSSKGTVTVYNSAGDTNIAVDVLGWYSSSTGGSSTGSSGMYYIPVTPQRICDTRSGNPSHLSGIALTQCQSRTLQYNGVLSIKVDGIAGIPASAGAVVMNVTATDAASPGYVTAWPGGNPRYVTSSLNVVKGLVSANQIVVEPDASGNISFYNSTDSVNLIVDVEGYFSLSSSGATQLIPMTPSRICDTRLFSVSFVSDQCTGHTLVAGTSSQTLTVQVADTGGIPSITATASTAPYSQPPQAVIANITVTDATQAGYLTVYPAGESLPIISSINFSPNRVVSNTVSIKLGTAGQVSIFLSSGSAQVIVDTVGWYF